MKKITIIGSGFAGLTAVKTIRKKDKQAEITLISPKAELVYMPSLIWVPSGAASGRPGRTHAPLGHAWPGPASGSAHARRPPERFGPAC